jgi:hypothetical protein
MAITDPLVLAADVLLVAVTELAPEVQRQLTWQDGDFAITRPRSRTPSRIVDAPSAALLRQFEKPCTVSEAVISFSRERGADPETTLVEAYPLLDALVRAGFLVTEGSAEGERIQPSLDPGLDIAGFTVHGCVQVLEDTELYQVRGTGSARPWAALKIVRAGLPGASRSLAAGLRREAAVLGRLAAAAEPQPEGAPGRPLAPRALASGEWEGRAYLVVEWCGGVDAVTAAGELRRAGGAAAHGRLLELCRSIADAYRRLHEQGVVHGDIHPRNVLVGGGGEVVLIDFGLARWEGLAGELAPVGRGGVGFFFEPELAVAALAGRPAPAATTAGEQYAVAALLYLLLCGAHYLDFSLEREEMLRQIAQHSPLAFAGRDLEPWPALEAVLGRALAKDPADRFGSLGELCSALAAVAAAQREAPPADRPRRAAAVSQSERLLGEVLARVQPEGTLWREGHEPPRASLNYGAAGVAYALYRIGMAREDAALLAQADLWAARATREARDGGDDAFYDSRIDITAETVGRVSPYHTTTGPLCVQALIANARGDAAAASWAAAEFAALAAAECPNPDLTLGRSGLLLAAALLFDALGEPAPAPSASSTPSIPSTPAAPATPSRPPIRPAPAADRRATAAAAPAAAEEPEPPEPGRPALSPPASGESEAAAAAHRDGPPLWAAGEALLRGLWQEIDALPAIAQCEDRRNLGLAHGWAGYLYATLQWCRATGRPLPGGLTARLQQLADCAMAWQRGLRWQWYGRGRDDGGELAVGSMPGWCNGSAGMVHLFGLAYRLLRDPAYLDCCAGAAWNAWEEPVSGGSLCCGLAGRAYSLLSLHRLLLAQGDASAEDWLRRARELAERAAAEIVRSSEAPDSLYKGKVGVAVLAADLARPEASAMPFCEEEGWGPAA